MVFFLIFCWFQLEDSSDEKPSNTVDNDDQHQENGVKGPEEECTVVPGDTMEASSVPAGQDETDEAGEASQQESTKSENSGKNKKVSW